jgi:protein arginine kinase activator
MKCDQCDNEATVHDLSIRNGVKIERHLCESCAQQQGLSAHGGTSLAELMKAMIVPAATPVTIPGLGTAKPAACPNCKTTFSEFKQNGLLGCAECYRTFESQLGPLLERAHEGGVRHTGKTPRRAESAGNRSSVVDLEQRAQRLATLRRELDMAVQSEQYEQAARLRDEMRRLLDSGNGPQEGVRG